MVHHRAFMLALAAGSAVSVSISFGQLATPSSYPNPTLTAPTSSILLDATAFSGLQNWWNNPSGVYQTAVKNSVNSVANGSLVMAVPTTLAETTNQASTAQAKALRWMLTGNGDTSNQDFIDVRNVLTNYAKASGGSDITGPLSSKGYAVAFDFINAGLSASERSAIISRLQSNVTFSSPNPQNNHAVINYAARGLFALVEGDRSGLNSALSGFSTAYANITTNDGFYTDGDRYLDYSMGTLAPFFNAYQNGSNDPAGIAQIENAAGQHARYALGIRLPNGLSPTFHNSDTTALAIQELSHLVADPTLKAATIWYADQLNDYQWSGSGNPVLNNQYGWTDLMWTVDNVVTPAAPNWSPTYFSGGQAKISTFRNDWGTGSNYLATIAGIDGSIGSFAHADTGAITLAANGTEVIVEPGYARYNGIFGFGADPKEPNTPPEGSPNLDTSLATEHNVLLARNTGTSTWGIGGNGKNATQTTGDITITNRMDSAERGSFKGVADFSTLRANYTGSGAGVNVQERRSTAMMNESAADRGYFVMADSFRSTNGTNKDFAINLIGKSTAANTQVMADTANYKKLRWSVDTYLGDYSTLDSASYPDNYIQNSPYNQSVSGQVIAHVVSSNAMDSVAQDSSWMVENWGVFIKTQRMRVSVSNTLNGAFLTFFETGPSNFTSQWAVTPMSGANYAAARIDDASAGWTDWHISQTNNTNLFATAAGANVSIDSGELASDGQYAYLRRAGSGMDLDSVMISRGTTISSGGQTLFTFSNPVTASLLYTQMSQGDLLGTLSMDDFTDGTVLMLTNVPGNITSVTYDNQPLNNFTADSVVLPYINGLQSVSFTIHFTAVPEPASGSLLLLALGLLLPRRRQPENSSSAIDCTGKLG
ncbi:MAG: heparinase II/III family protein [Phycisphaerales bacterium]|jgi:hypothetical protein|nr:heparinase II/III family protein [Phycisphaerales bacterium]